MAGAMMMSRDDTWVVTSDPFETWRQSDRRRKDAA
jgi:hypothetical protein